MLTEFQSDLDKLQSKIDECKCSKGKSLFFILILYIILYSESIHLKPSVVESDQLQQSSVTKPSFKTCKFFSFNKTHLFMTLD